MPSSFIGQVASRYFLYASIYFSEGFFLFWAWKKHRVANAVFTSTLVVSLLCFGAMARTGYYGGQIRHTEIRNGNANVDGNNNEGEKNAENGGKEKDND